MDAIWSAASTAGGWVAGAGLVAAAAVAMVLLTRRGPRKSRQGRKGRTSAKPAKRTKPAEPAEPERAAAEARLRAEVGKYQNQFGVSGAAVEEMARRDPAAAAATISKMMRQ